MTERQLSDGRVAYYWHPNRRDIAAGFTIPCETLGASYWAAIDRAGFLNKMLDDWRASRGESTPQEESTRFGSLAWMFSIYMSTKSFTELSERTKPGYRAAMDRLTEIKTKEGKEAGAYLVKTLTPLAVDKIYAKLRLGKKGQEIFRQANLSIWLAGKAWRIVRRRYPDVFPEENPFEGLERNWKRTPKKAASRLEAYALSKALKDLGHPHLGVVPLVCYEWHQRPENVLAGYLRWSDIRPWTRPDAVRLEHHKTGEEVWLPLEAETEDESGEKGKELLFPEIEAYLEELPRLGTPVVLTPGKRGPKRPYSLPYAQHLVQQARANAKLPAHVTMDACRHGGMTELGDAEATEQEIMSASGHRSPEAARVYVKRTEKQRIAAIRKRRAWVQTVSTKKPAAGEQ
jgi:hypothetical protein